MHIQKKKVLTGTVSLLLLTGATYPAIALPTAENGSNQLVAQAIRTRAVRGVITDIDGNEVTLRKSDGTLQTLRVNRPDLLSRLRTGMLIATTFNDRNVVGDLTIVQNDTRLVQQPVVRTTTYVSQPIRGTVRSIMGDMVTLEMPDGKLRQVMISADDIRRLNLEPGMQVSLMLDRQNIASSVNVMYTNPGYTSTRREQVTVERRTVQTPVPVMRQTPTVTQTEVMQTTEVEPQPAARPVRALW